jgi:DNA-binding transcriptional regulator YhcF (GntR family)
MHLWFARGSEISIREQLVTQIILGILGDDLAPGQRLPSTRELARRFHLHPNTISAGYRQLARERWVEQRRGSGVFVRANKPETSVSAELALDQMIASLFRSARKEGVSLPSLRARLRQWLELQPPDHFLLIEPDEELRRIVAAEMQQAVSLPVMSCGRQHSSRAAHPRNWRAAGFAGRNRIVDAAFSIRASLAGTVATGALGRSGGRCLEVAGILKAGAHYAYCRWIPFRQPGVTRPPQGELAAGIEADVGGSV